MAQAAGVPDAAWANRGFRGRAAVWIAKRGIRQFLNIGTGLPPRDNTRPAVQRIAPSARVVYVDIDPMKSTLAGELYVSNGPLQADPESHAAVAGPGAGALPTRTSVAGDDTPRPDVTANGRRRASYARQAGRATICTPA
jgi:hypothetical protein